ncbi:hypothetical protein GF314_07335 [bacterium]|nr:hypothetical protein [bacterium]
MKRNWMILVLMTLAMLTFVACSSDDGGGDDPSDPTGPTVPGDGTFAGVAFNDFSDDARRVLPPVYSRTKSAADSLWHDGEFPILGKVFSDEESMSIHRNIDEHDITMMQIEEFVQQVSEYEAEHGELPDGPIDFQGGEFGDGTLTFNLAEPTTPIAVPAVCQTVFGRTEVAVDYVMQVSIQYDGGEGFESPYFGFTTGGQTEVVYYWSVGYDDDGQPDGSQLFYAVKDTLTDEIEIAGAYFKPDGPGDEDRCNWVYHLTGNADMEFTYNMGWYSESPEFQLFGCVQGSGDKDSEFGLRYHQYTDTSGWDEIDPWYVSEQIFGPVGDEDFAFIEEAERSGTIEDYVDATVMYQRDDSPLDEIPNPFAGLFTR